MGKTNGKGSPYLVLSLGVLNSHVEFVEVNCDIQERIFAFAKNGIQVFLSIFSGNWRESEECIRGLQ